MLSKLILTVSCLLEAAGCFWLCLGEMPKSCFGILKGGDSVGSGKRYYGGDIVAAGVFSSCWRAKTPPTTEWFSPAAMVNTSAPPSVYYSLAPLVVTQSGPLQSPFSLGNTFFGWSTFLPLFLKSLSFQRSSHY